MLITLEFLFRRRWPRQDRDGRRRRLVVERCHEVADANAVVIPQQGPRRDLLIVEECAVAALHVLDVELARDADNLRVLTLLQGAPKPTVANTQTSSALVEQFKNEQVFGKQIDIAKAIVSKHDASDQGIPGAATGLRKR